MESGKENIKLENCFRADDLENREILLVYAVAEDGSKILKISDNSGMSIKEVEGNIAHLTLEFMNMLCSNVVRNQDDRRELRLRELQILNGRIVKQAVKVTR